MIDKLHAVRNEMDAWIEATSSQDKAAPGCEDVERWRAEIAAALERIEALDMAAGNAVAAYLLRTPGTAADSISSGPKSSPRRSQLINRIGTAMVELERELRTSRGK